MKTFKQYLTEASVAEIEAYYQKLKGMAKDELIRQVGSRLDPSHLKSETRDTLINAALNNHFKRADLDAWNK
jgi:hypothetical protein